MLEDSPFIRKEPVAKMYELNFHKENNAFEFKMRKEDLDFLYAHERIKELFSKTEKLFSIPAWDFSTKNVFGYGEFFKKVSDENGWISYKAPVTVDNDLAITITFVDILQLYSYPFVSRRPLPGEAEQEMLLDTSCSKEMRAYGAAMSADLSIKFSLWIYNQTPELRAKVNPKVHDAMWSLYKHFKLKPYGETGGLDEKGFILFPPAGVYTCQFGILRQEQADFEEDCPFGYETFCHNLDHRRQQLVLLAGFATICEFYRNS